MGILFIMHVSLELLKTSHTKNSFINRHLLSAYYEEDPVQDTVKAETVKAIQIPTLKHLAILNKW